jgi:Ca2+-binding EF-hand superfamily protein
VLSPTGTIQLIPDSEWPQSGTSQEDVNLKYQEYSDGSQSPSMQRLSPKGGRGNAYRKAMEKSKSEPGLVTLPALQQSATSPSGSTETDDVYGASPSKIKRNTTQRMEKRSRSQPPLKMSLPPLDSSPSRGPGEHASRRKVRARGNERVDKALSASRSVLAGAANVLAESRGRDQAEKIYVERRAKSEQPKYAASPKKEDVGQAVKIVKSKAKKQDADDFVDEELYFRKTDRSWYNSVLHSTIGKPSPRAVLNGAEIKKELERAMASSISYEASAPETSTQQQTPVEDGGESKETTVVDQKDAEVEKFDDTGSLLLSVVESPQGDKDPAENSANGPPESPAEGSAAFSEKEVARLHGAFHRFTESFSYDLDVSILPGLLKYLGHGITKDTGDAIQNIVKSVTPYEYLDFGEFLAFMEKFLIWEHSYYKVMFDKFDDDSSGELSMKEIRQVMQSLDILPINAKLNEALGTVDDDCNGQLGFEEFAQFLLAYSTNEGFTQQQIKELQKIHAEFVILPDDRIPVSSVADALVLFFGVSFSKECRDLEKELLDRPKPEGKKSDVPEGLAFQDLLLLARQLREIFYKELATMGLDEQERTFREFDADGSGTIDKKELFVCLRSFKYVPLDMIVDEIFHEIHDAPSGESWTDGPELDFDHFFDFMLLWRQREGFLKKETEEFYAVFNKFDEDASGQISTLEMGDIFRYLGYVIKPEVVSRYVLQVDDNQSHTLDFKEFLHLMQIHRSGELTDLEVAFADEAEEGQLHKNKAERSLIELFQYEKDDLGKLVDELPEATLTFENYVRLADQCRIITIEKCRKMAGYSQAELDRLMESFNAYDKDHSGTITCTELMGVMAAFGWKPKTREARDEIMTRLEKARVAAKEAGVEDSTDDASADINFWEFVQLARLIQRHDEAAHEEKINSIAAKLKFSTRETAEFHDIFLHWVRNKQGASGSEAEEHEDVDADTDSSLHKEDAKRLVKSLGVRFTPERRRIFEKEIVTIIGHKSNYLDFPAFLKLMRWLIDTKFHDENWSP